jgi:membrane protein required for colicin V production
MIIDALFILLFAFAVFKGFTKGFIVAVFSFVAGILGIAAAMKFSVAVAGWLQNYTSVSGAWLSFAAFLIVLFGVIITIRIVAKIIEKSVEFILMGWLNKLAGIIFYLLIYLCIFSVLLFFAVQMKILSEETITSSKTYPFVQPFGPVIIDGFGKIIPFFKNMFSELEMFFENGGKGAT